MLKKVLVLSVSLMALSVNATTLEEEYPVTDTVTLKDGTPVTMPFHVKGTTTGIAGFIDAEKSKKFIFNNDFEVVNVTCDGEKTNVGVGIFYVQNITDSPVGAYNETVNTIMVKRKGADDLPLACPPPQGSDPLLQLDYLATAVGTADYFNQPNAAAGLPLDYAFYNSFLELNNPKAVAAGLEIWGYPKVLANVDVDITDTNFKVDVKTRYFGVPTVEINYQRKIGSNQAIFNKGDNVLPKAINPAPDVQYAQMSGILSAKSGWIQPFVGEFKVSPLPFSVTALTLNETKFKPVGVLEFTDLEGVAFASYEKQQ